MGHSSPIPELDDEYFVFVPGRLTKDHVLRDSVPQDPPSRLQKDQSAQVAKSAESTESEESSKSTESAESKHLEEGQAEWIDTGSKSILSMAEKSAPESMNEMMIRSSASKKEVAGPAESMDSTKSAKSSESTESGESSESAESAEPTEPPKFTHKGPKGSKGWKGHSAWNKNMKHPHRNHRDLHNIVSDDDSVQDNGRTMICFHVFDTPDRSTSDGSDAVSVDAPIVRCIRLFGSIFPSAKRIPESDSATRRPRPSKKLHPTVTTLPAEVLIEEILN